ncbi:hypothetical protein PR048_028815 [Dryococelus australis]|uniref:Uncharacterized protein n=1 Tax=Dryococelus australis TaxID=614101 RepID=A0ABQ9GFE8_9NEOP|nr:hypothetical protein PR048_028815 [Dryococelus australis]
MQYENLAANDNKTQFCERNDYEEDTKLQDLQGSIKNIERNMDLLTKKNDISKAISFCSDILMRLWKDSKDWSHEL